MRLRLQLLLPLALVLLLLPPSAAAADGPPTERDAGPNGVVAPSGRERLVAVPIAGERTVLTRSRTSGGQVWGAGVLHGYWGVPVVAFDGTSGGLVADRRTAVLMQPFRKLERRVSRFAVVDTRRLHIRRTIALKGTWSYDAISPDASTLYLTQTLNRQGTRYAVRAYDLRAHRLLAKPVVDPSEPDEPLRGWPSTRTTGPGGRWEYTLYAGSKEPFIHALDTVHRTSICIDLPKRLAKAKRIWNYRLELHGGRIAVVDRDKVVVSASRYRPEAASTGGGPPWIAALVAATGLLAAAGVRRLSR
jgi:hypothetical protein